MNKFKFGDKVQCPDMSVRMFLHNRQGGIAVVTDQWGKKDQFLNDTLQPIPHPDTIQLNALKEKLLKLSDVSFTCNLCGEDNEISTEIQDIIDFAISEYQRIK